jgi:hypothetical protein
MNDRAAGFCVLLLLVLPTVAGGQARDLDARVDPAIARGVEYLRREQSRAGHWDYRLAHDHRLGMTALAGLALLENGVSVDDEAIDRARPTTCRSRFSSSPGSRGRLGGSLMA